MSKKIIILAVCCLLCFSQLNGLCKADDGVNIEEIDISVTLIPVRESEYCYTFSTNSKSQIDRIMHMLDAIDYVDDGKMMGGADIPTVDITLKRADNTVDRCGFINGRFYDSEKQYAVEKNEYTRFLDFIYALKTGKLVLDDATFQPSPWAESAIEQAVDKGLIPKLNQINYTGKINRLEVCQIIDNFLRKQNIAETDISKNVFSDTRDESVIRLYEKGIIKGRSDDEFCPYDAVTREEFATILKRVLDVTGISGEAGSGSVYNDDSEIAEWAKESVESVCAQGIMIGDTDGNFRPKSAVTKEEAVSALLRITER